MPAAPSPAAPAPAASSIHALDAIRLLRTAGAAMFAQAQLHGQLAWVEWTEEKNRLLKMLVVVLLGFACLLCVLLAGGALVLAFFWETPYRIAAVAALLALYGYGTRLAWQRFQLMSAQSDRSFAATREELAIDMALLRSRL